MEEKILSNTERGGEEKMCRLVASHFKIVKDHLLKVEDGGAERGGGAKGTLSLH